MRYPSGFNCIWELLLSMVDDEKENVSVKSKLNHNLRSRDTSM
jgi:hypothetical protein